MPDENEGYRSKEEQAFQKRRKFLRVGPVLVILVTATAAGLTYVLSTWWIGAYKAFQSWHVDWFNSTCSKVSLCRDMPGTLSVPEWLFVGILFLELFTVGLLVAMILPLLSVMLRRAPLWIMLAIFFLSNAASIAMGYLMHSIPVDPSLRSFAQDWTAGIMFTYVAIRFAESIVRSMTELAWMLYTDFIIIYACAHWATWSFRGSSDPPEPMAILWTMMLLLPLAEFAYQYTLYRSGKSRF